jgi:hypothetical protein
VNLNSRIYPQTPFFTPPERRKPLQAVFANLPGIDAAAVTSSIAEYQTDARGFSYIGALANVPGVARGNTQWEREFILRNLAGSLTTKSNTFGIWGVAQVVRKSRANVKYDQFEARDQVLAEKRFHAIVERYIWPGKDGVPGNAHTAAGKWDRLAKQTATISLNQGITDTLFQLPGSPPLLRAGAGQPRLNLDTAGAYPEFDGPERVGANPFTEAALGRIQYRQSRLEEAYNPPQPLIKYRIVSFRYLDQ